MKYRADIDGLRAVAVLFVLFFHAGLKLFPSGFVGVDVFFVISGFLISSIIRDSLRLNRFSFIEFYSRRLWRLQPVFICLLVCTVLGALCFYLPEDLVQYFKSARKSSLFMSNSYFSRETTGYFSPDNSQFPLLHTWSLSIEWQCYLCLPLGIYFLYQMLDTRRVSQVFYMMTLLFFSVAVYSSVKNPTQTYYQLSSRIFEFLIGSCIVFGQNRFSFHKYFLELINGVALVTLVYVAMHSSIELGFPNGYALAVCGATALIIASGQQGSATNVSKLLCLKPLVFIGMLSYSLYIWHWPVFVFIRYLGIEETALVLFLAFGLIFILAYLSWRFIEKPARQFNKVHFRDSVTLLFLLPVILIHISNEFIKKHEGCPQRFEETTRIDAQLKQYANPQRPLCLHDKSIEVNNNCVLGAQNKTRKTGFMFGDSYSNHFWGFMDTLAKDADLSVLAHSMAACLSLPGISLYDWNSKVYTACNEQTARYYAMIRKNHYDFVILGENWEGYLANKLITHEPMDGVKKRIEKALDEALQMIVAAGSTPVLIKSIAVGDAYTCFLTHIKQRKKYTARACDFAMNAKELQWQENMFLHMKKKYTQLILLDPKKVQCPLGQCLAEINGVPVFRDAGHLNDYASYHLAFRYLDQYKNPLVI